MMSMAKFGRYKTEVEKHIDSRDWVALRNKVRLKNS